MPLFGQPLSHPGTHSPNNTLPRVLPSSPRILNYSGTSVLQVPHQTCLNAFFTPAKVLSTVGMQIVVKSEPGIDCCSILRAHFID